MLEIRDIRIENCCSYCVTDHTIPEVSFSLHSDIPDTRLESAEITVQGRTIRCGLSHRLPPLGGSCRRSRLMRGITDCRAHFVRSQ